MIGLFEVLLGGVYCCFCSFCTGFCCASQYNRSPGAQQNEHSNIQQLNRLREYHADQLHLVEQHITEERKLISNLYFRPQHIQLPVSAYIQNPAMRNMNWN